MPRSDPQEMLLLAAREFDQLSEEDQQEAVRLAFHEGMDAVERLCSSNGDHMSAPYLDVAAEEDVLRNPHRSRYYLSVIGPAAREGLVEEELEDWWRESLSGQDSEDDPRVKKFLEAWLERAKQIVKWQTDNGIRR